MKTNTKESWNVELRIYAPRTRTRASLAKSKYLTAIDRRCLWLVDRMDSFVLGFPCLFVLNSQITWCMQPWIHSTMECFVVIYPPPPPDWSVLITNTDLVHPTQSNTRVCMGACWTQFKFPINDLNFLIPIMTARLADGNRIMIASSHGHDNLS